MLRDVPSQIATHIAISLASLAGECSSAELEQYDNSGTRRRHVPIIRAHVGVKPFDREAQSSLTDALRAAAQTKEDLADIINIGIEELIRARRELPGFSTLQEEARAPAARRSTGQFTGASPQRSTVSLRQNGVT